MTQDQEEVVRSKNQSVLLVEADAPLRLFMWRFLNADGYTVFLATDAFEGLQKLSRVRAIDLLITNFEMHGMNGPQLVHHSREIVPELQSVFTHPHQCFSDLDADASWLLKPFGPDELLSAVRKSFASNSDFNRCLT